MLLQIGLLQACPIEAQTTYLPLLEPNKEWYNALMFNYDSGVFLADTRFCTEYEQLIDTIIINEKEYQRFLVDVSYVHGSTRGINAIYPVLPFREVMYLDVREERGKVYAIKEQYYNLLKELYPQEYSPYVSPEDFYLPEAEDDNEVLLYDFTLEEGQKYPYIGKVHVSNVSSLTTQDGHTRKIMTLSNGAVLIEGVGCVNSIGGIIVYQNLDVISQDLSNGEDNGKMVYARLSSCFTRDNEGIHYRYTYEKDGLFLNDIENTIRNLPAQPSFKDSHKSSILHPQSSIYYDLSGRRLSAPPAKGMYIEDGRVKIRD